MAAASIGHIYWTNTATSRGPSGPGINTVARADLNGGVLNKDLVENGDFVGAIAVNAKHIYWGSPERQTIARADLNGSHVNYDFIAGPYRTLGSVETLVVHGNCIYWASYGSTSIGRARIDGTHIERNFVRVGRGKRFVEVRGLAAEGKHLYWSDQEAGGTIGRVDLDGMHVRKRFIVNLGAVGSLVVYGKYLYWANAREHAIGRSDLSGKHRIKRFVVGPPSRTTIAVGAQHIYWTDPPMIGRANLSGKEVDRSFIFAGVEDEFGLESIPAGLALGP